MITGVGSISILSHNPKKSAEWYRNKLGFEIVSNQGHSVFVRPNDSQTPLVHLCGECDAWEKDRPGGRTGIWLRCGELIMHKDEKSGQLIPASDPDSVEKTYFELKEKGVEFVEELTTTSWGKYAILKDPDGNEIEVS